MALTDIALRNARPTEKPYKLTDEKGLYLLVILPYESNKWPPDAIEPLLAHQRQGYHKVGLSSRRTLDGACGNGAVVPIIQKGQDRLIVGTSRNPSREMKSLNICIKTIDATQSVDKW